MRVRNVSMANVSQLLFLRLFDFVDLIFGTRSSGRRTFLHGTAAE